MIYINSHSSTTVVLDGVPFSVAKGTPQFDRLQEAILNNDEDAARKVVHAGDEIEKSLAVYGDVEIFNGHVKFRGQPLNNYLVDVILRAGDPEPVANFLNNVMENPSRRAVQDLYKWCEAAQMPLTQDGCIIAYKLVREDFKDHYSGRFDNSPGKVVEVPRNEVDEDPNRVCSYGLHFCSASYLPHYGGSNSKVVLVKVHPRDVVAFPTDYKLAKARCCRYEVLEEIERGKLITVDETPIYDTWDIPDGDRFVVWNNYEDLFISGDYGDYAEHEEDARVFTRDEVIAFLDEYGDLDLDVRVAPATIQVGSVVRLKEGLTNYAWSRGHPSKVTRIEGDRVYVETVGLAHPYFGYPLEHLELVPEERFYIRDKRDGDYVTDADHHGIGVYQEAKPEPMDRATADEVMSRVHPHLCDYFVIVPEEENDDWSHN